LIPIYCVRFETHLVANNLHCHDLQKMEVGDMVLYESHSVMHGRPFSLKGKCYANVFIHFEPVPELEENAEGKLPRYILEDSIEVEKFQAGEYTYNSVISSENAKRLKPDDTRYPSHDAAGDGDLNALIEIGKEDLSALHMEDMNRWQPIHEAARSGHMDVMEFLAAQGADMNARTKAGQSVLLLVADYWVQDCF
jgi:prolyl 4-hydroxylase